jgi:hypothetical protein
MLLPSALPCDGNDISGIRSSRPLLRRFMPYSASSTSSSYITAISAFPESTPLAPSLNTEVATSYPSPQSPISTGIQSTCRALQSLLGVTPPPTSLNRTPSHLPIQRRPSPFAPLPIGNRVAKPCRSPTKPAIPPRGKNKRTRDVYESDSDNQQDSNSKENISSTYGYGYNYQGRISEDDPYQVKLFSTPKRRRLPGPTHIPFGLERSDFADLEDNPFTTPCTFFSPPVLQTRSLNSPFPQPNNHPSTPLSSSISPADNEDEDDEDASFWTPLDDAQLVTLVLEKLKLSKKDWDECARVLGAEGEGGSLGKRWRSLLDEGRVGLKGGVRFGRKVSKGRGDVRNFF